MIIEQGFMWFALGLLVAAFLVNRSALRLLDEATQQAIIWEAHRAESERLSHEAIVMFENAQRLKSARPVTPFEKRA